MGQSISIGTPGDSAEQMLLQYGQVNCFIWVGAGVGVGVVFVVGAVVGVRVGVEFEVGVKVWGGV